MNSIGIVLDDREYRVAWDDPVDVSIALRFNSSQPIHFGVEAASATPISVGDFIGDTREGGSCNVARVCLTPHCNGTHTECVGHVTEERIGVSELIKPGLLPARLVSITPIAADETDETYTPTPSSQDQLITRESLVAAFGHRAITPALLVRTLPNAPEKCSREYDPTVPTPYFTLEAMQWLVDHGVQHLLVDMPSIDRLQDDGHLNAHRVFWGLLPGERQLNQAKRPQATITEMIYVPNDVNDGFYLLNLQLAPFASDAAPSRPLLYRIEPR